MKKINVSSDNLVVKYVISVYQEKTKTVINTKNDDYEKIIEYVIFENSDVVKVSIGGDIVGSDIVPDNALDEYYIASSDFFAKIENNLIVKSK